MNETIGRRISRPFFLSCQPLRRTITATLVRQIASDGRDIRPFVPANVARPSKPNFSKVNGALPMKSISLAIALLMVDGHFLPCQPLRNRPIRKHADHRAGGRRGRDRPASDIAPQHVEQIKTLTRRGDYDNVAFHRVIEGFMAQTGDVQFGKFDAGYNSQAARDGWIRSRNITSEFSDVLFEPRHRSAWPVRRTPTPPIRSSSSPLRRRRTSNGAYTVVGTGG